MTATWEIREGDCVEVMAAMPEASVDAVVCDPPYGLEFMGKDWDRLTGVGSWATGSSKTGYPDAERLARPSFGSSRNPMCRACRKHQRGSDRCVCASPDFDERPADGNRLMQDWHEAWAREALRVLKPGGHLLAFGGTRTYHRLTCAIEDAGFEVRDCLSWLYGSGFPKSLDVSKAIDKAAGVEREVVAQGAPVRRMIPGADQNRTGSWIKDSGREFVPTQTAPATDAAERWDGWGTALKPAFEPIVLARRPLAGTVAGNVLAHGTGALNIDGCRIGTSDDLNGGAYSGDKRQRDGYSSTDSAPGAEPLSRLNRGIGQYEQPTGRWPANVLLDEQAAAMLDEQTGALTSGARRSGDGRADETDWRFRGGSAVADAGGASRFFYCAKASAGERGEDNCHPTVKPTELMRWLVRLVTPPGGTVLDPFAGSGTTGIAAMREGFAFVGIEREAEYVELARERIRQDAPLLNTCAEVAA